MGCAFRSGYRKKAKGKKQKAKVKNGQKRNPDLFFLSLLPFAF